MEHCETLRDGLRSAVVWQPEREARLFLQGWRARGRGDFRALVLTAAEGLPPSLAESALETVEHALSWPGTYLEGRGELLLLAENGEPRELLGFLERRHPGPRYLLGVSGRVPPEEVRRGYEEARMALQVNFYRPATIAWTGETVFSQEHDYAALIPLERNLTDAVLSGVHTQECRRLVREYLEYFEGRLLLPRLARDTVFRFLCTLDRTLRYLDPLCDSRLSGVTWEELAACPTVRALGEKLADLLQGVCRAGEADGGSPESCVLRVMEYLRCHLDRIPSLDHIAREFHVNKFVFCRQFKSLTGETFGDYIKRARLEEACRLLRETGLRVYQVADRVGFQNESSFSGFFKRETGLSPREYRLSGPSA